eukprot:1186181-Prorocentrum_minimum.AAC.3
MAARRTLASLVRLFASFTLMRNVCADVDLQRSLEQLSERATRPFVVVQVGAHVGFTENDPVHVLAFKYNWKGVLLEPVPELYQQLVSNYGSNKALELKFENVALGDFTGRAPFYQRRNADFQRTADMYGAGLRTQMGSLRRTFGRKGHRIWVNTITLTDLLEKHGFSHIDYLQIDAEGMDGVVVRQIPFPRVMPQVIQFERKHLNTSEQQESIQLLHENNYTVFKGGAPDFDVTAFSTSARAALRF